MINVKNWNVLRWKIVQIWVGGRFMNCNKNSICIIDLPSTKAMENEGINQEQLHIKHAACSTPIWRTFLATLVCAASVFVCALVCVRWWCGGITNNFLQMKNLLNEKKFLLKSKVPSSTSTSYADIVRRIILNVVHWKPYNND